MEEKQKVEKKELEIIHEASLDDDSSEKRRAKYELNADLSDIALDDEDEISR